MKTQVIREWEFKASQWRLVKRKGTPIVQYKSNSGFYRTRFHDVYVGDAALYFLAIVIIENNKNTKDGEE